MPDIAAEAAKVAADAQALAVEAAQLAADEVSSQGEFPVEGNAVLAGAGDGSVVVVKGPVFDLVVVGGGWS